MGSTGDQASGRRWQTLAAARLAACGFGRGQWQGRIFDRESRRHRPTMWPITDGAAGEPGQVMAVVLEKSHPGGDGHRADLLHGADQLPQPGQLPAAIPWLPQAASLPSTHVFGAGWAGTWSIA